MLERFYAESQPVLGRELAERIMTPEVIDGVRVYSPTALIMPRDWQLESMGLTADSQIELSAAVVPFERKDRFGMILVERAREVNELCLFELRPGCRFGDTGLDLSLRMLNACQLVSWSKIVGFAPSYFNPLALLYYPEQEKWQAIAYTHAGAWRSDDFWQRYGKDLTSPSVEVSLVKQLLERHFSNQSSRREKITDLVKLGSPLEHFLEHRVERRQQLTGQYGELRAGFMPFDEAYQYRLAIWRWYQGLMMATAVSDQDPAKRAYANLRLYENYRHSPFCLQQVSAEDLDPKLDLNNHFPFPSPEVMAEILKMSLSDFYQFSIDFYDINEILWATRGEQLIATSFCPSLFGVAREIGPGYTLRPLFGRSVWSTVVSSKELIRIVGEKGYEILANEQVKKANFSILTREIADVLANPEALILDAGFGSGEMEKYLSAVDQPVAATTIGLDLDKEMIKTGAGQVDLAVMADLEGKLPFDSEVFDAVVLSYVTHELEDNLEHLFSQLGRCLKMDGRLVFNVYLGEPEEAEAKTDIYRQNLLSAGFPEDSFTIKVVKMPSYDWEPERLELVVTATKT